ncbi:signal recognition particle 72 [Rhodnius prolixus]|uniref:Signal recognition particle subunit SRP72 n=1 Tax=Rhodnius prolixus TaxID=13249 RepID=R4G5M3_RHOPR
MEQGDPNRHTLYVELQKYGQVGDHERTLKLANKILHSYPHDAKAFHVRIYSLIHLSRFEDVLLAFKKHPDLGQGLEFEKAYAMYRLNKVKEALDVLEAVQDPPLKITELKAQVYYRLERFQDCFDSYREVLKLTDDDFDDERQTNLAAIVVNLCANGKDQEMPQFTSETYELAYNEACHLIAKGRFIDAEKKLKYAEKLCRDAFDDDAPVEDIDEELNVIKLQQAYVHHAQGREKEAMQIYSSTLKKKPSDIALLAVANNNIVAINRDQNLFDSKKKMKATLNEATQLKLTASQKRTVSINNCLLNIYTNQGDQALAICDDLMAKHPEAKETAVLMKAAVLMREGKAEEARKLLEKVGKETPSIGLKMCLAKVQLLLLEGMLWEARKELATLDDDSLFKPGIVSSLVTLYLEVGEPEQAAKLFEKAVSWNQKNKTVGDLSALWRQAADFHLRSGKPQVAASSLEELLKMNSRDVITLARLIIAYAQFDTEKANRLSKELPHLIDLTPNIDAGALESSSWMMGLKAIKKAAKVDPVQQTPGTPNVALKKKKSRRRKRLPKNYDPNVDPDPERWLPKRERSTFKKKKDRRNKEVGKGTQGGSAHAADQYDITKMAGSSQKKEVTTSPMPEVRQSQQQRKAQQKKKKKGKR